jgi:4-hydroxybenzoate polyprenyltransferase
MFARLVLILEMIRFSHTLFALPFALFAAALAWRQNAREGVPFRWQELAGIVLCMVFARSAAMAFNRLADRKLDAQNPRTASRHIPTGLLGVPAVAAFCLLCAAGFVASTAFFLPNTLPLVLSLPVLAYLCGYSYAKRFSVLCHYWLGGALALAPLAAWLALRGRLEWAPALLGAAVCFWVGGFDIVYACQDYEFDVSRRLKSIPARFGVPRALRLAALSHLLMIVCLGLLWWNAELGYLFLAGVALVALLLIWEHSLVRPNDLTRVNLAFFHVNAIISLGLLAVGLADIWVASRGG